MHVEKQLLEPYMLEPVEHKVSLYVKPEERQPSNLSRDRISHSTNCSVTTFPQFQVLLQNYLVYIHRPKKKRILTQSSHYWQLNLGYATEVLKWCKHKGKRLVQSILVLFPTLHSHVHMLLDSLTTRWERRMCNLMFNSLPAICILVLECQNG